MNATPTDYKSLVAFFVDLINSAVPVLFTIVFLYFVWKVVDAWVINGGDEKRVEEGKQYVTAAVVTFVIMISVWGIVALVKTSFFG